MKKVIRGRKILDKKREPKSSLFSQNLFFYDKL